MSNWVNELLSRRKKIEQIVSVQVLVLLYFLFFAWASYYVKMKAQGRGFVGVFAKESLDALTTRYVYKTCINMKFFLWNMAFHISVKWTSGLKFYQKFNFVFIYIVNICLKGNIPCKIYGITINDMMTSHQLLYNLISMKYYEDWM